MLESDSGEAIVTDPYHQNIGFKMPPVKAGAVTLSHLHSDHNNVRAVGGEPQVFSREGEYSFGSIKIKAIGSYHDDAHGAKRGQNLIFKFDVDGVELCHMGDIGEEASDSLVEKIGHVNVLMIPVGGTYTVTAKGAKRYVDLIKPDVVVPMHFKTSECTLDISGVKQFSTLFDDEQIVVVGAPRAEFEKSDMRGGKERVYLFDKLC